MLSMPEHFIGIDCIYDSVFSYSVAIPFGAV